MSLSTIRCPVCTDQPLEAVATSVGNVDRCPSCRGLFIAQEVVVACSPEQSKCQEALAETKALLLPTERWCPKCYQKLTDGRVRSRGVILTLCDSCQILWTDFTTLKRFEEVVEKNLKSYLEVATRIGMAGASALPATRPPERAIPERQDTALGKLFRAFARSFDRIADLFSRRPSKPSTDVPPPIRVKKPLIREVKPAGPQEPAKVSEELAAPKSIEIPEFVFPEETKAPPAAKAPEPAPEISGEEAKRREEATEAFRRLLMEGPVHEPERKPEPKKTQVPKPAPKPKAPTIEIRIPKPAPVPASEKKWVDLPQPKPTPSGLGAFLGNLFKPKPKPPKPKPEVKKAVELPKPKPAGAGFFSKFFGAFKAASGPSTKKPVVKPAVPVSEPQRPEPVAKPVLAKPTPKPKKVKEPSTGEWQWRILPMGFMVVGACLTAFRDFGFEAPVAVCWSLAGCAVGVLIRLTRQYPFKPFQETTMEVLAARKDVTVLRGVPVILNGNIVLADEQKPKGEVVYSEAGVTLPLNRLSGWDVIPRLFGLSNPRQLLKGEVTLQGWYRKAAVPFLEVHEVRSGKTFRKSMVRSLRRASAILVLVLSVIISLSLE